MPWFNVDDGFDTHPKVRKAGNAAAGLFCRLGSYSARHLTEGQLDADVVRDYGTPATVRKLITVGMLHPVGHGCEKCEQPMDGGYVMHDYLDYNRSRKQIEAARENGRKRQQKGRDRARDERNASDSDANLGANSRENAPSSSPNPHENEPLFGDEPAGQDGASQRDTLQGATGVQSPPLQSEVPPTEEPPPYPPHADDRLPAVRDAGEAAVAGAPAWLQPLISAMGQAGMHVPWKFKGDDLIRIHNDIHRLGIPLMIEQARRGWQSARTPVISSRFFYDSWHAVPTPEPATDGRPNLRAVGGPSKTSEYLEDMAAIAEELRQRKTGGA
ncbi:hypothetical protein ACFY15_00525 [Streptomyces sp. NPDC001373]|uniref:hypothetical protein n=1 Tax=Streptomyces sp. NPDC001373 TaxID=3364565 RepID=UPI0036949B75